MEQKDFNYSMKNIPVGNKNSYKKCLMDKMGNLFKRMRWTVIHYENNCKDDRKETFGFKTSKTPEQQDLLTPFENEMYDMLCNIKFKNRQNNFQKQLTKDVKEIKSSKLVYVKADKSTNVYTMKPEDYKKMRTESITKTYKKTSESLKDDINSECSDIAETLGIADRMEVLAEREPFITLKDHKPNFDSKPTCRLINPAKSEMGIVSQKILKKINQEIRATTQMNQWQNTTEFIDWYKELDNKKTRTFIQFDIENFYPSITEETLNKAIEYAKTITAISQLEEEVIKHSRRSLLFNGGANWIKKDGSEFDVTMGSYDGAEVCELVGLYMLNSLTQRFGKECIGLYRDDGAMAQTLSKKQADKARKDIIAIFKSCKFTITVEILLSRMNFLDVTVDLPSEKYWPYRKPNNNPLYIHSKSNHPPAVLKHLPKNITERLSSISCNQEEFDKSKPIYEEALKKSGFNTSMTYTEHNTKKDKRRRVRKNIIWFNPPYDQNVNTNVAQRFLKMIDLHFPKGHKYHQLFNRNTVKVSYSCMKNIDSIISSHNKKVLGHGGETNTGQKMCNCRNPNECPLNGACLSKSIVYKATVEAQDTPTKQYIGITEPTFKSRWNNHLTSFKRETYKHATELSSYIWKLKDGGHSPDNIKVSWSIVQHSSDYQCGSRRCDLCLSEKVAIAIADKSSLLNSRTEVVSKCRHRRKFQCDRIKDSAGHKHKVKMK